VEPVQVRDFWFVIIEPDALLVLGALLVGRGARRTRDVLAEAVASLELRGFLGYRRGAGRRNPVHVPVRHSASSLAMIVSRGAPSRSG
jgi:hypothetical protein